MQVERCRLLGYCHGVSDTIKKANKCISLAEKRNTNAYSIGNLIHNEHVVKHFVDRGMKVISKPEDAQPGIALIRAHGMPDVERKAFEDAGYTLIDSTCSKILKTLSLMDKAAKKGRLLLVIGERNHAETLTLMGHGSSAKFLVCNEDDLNSFISTHSPDAHVSVFVQTTFSSQLYEHFCILLQNHFSDAVFENKLCLACIQRKKYAIELAKECGCMVVVGSKISSNSKELATWLSTAGKPVYMFSSAADVEALSPAERERLASYGKVGVCSGTSAPKEVIDELCEKLQSI